MINRKETIEGFESLLKTMYANAPEDRKNALSELEESLDKIKENEEKLNESKDNER